MAPPTLEDIVLLEMTIRGRLVVPQNNLEYQAQVQKNHNAGFHHHKPAMFILCRDNGDVQQALKFVTQHEMAVSIRSCGHSACGSSIKEGSVVIDVGNINHLDYDEATQTITFGPGCTLSDVSVALSRQNRMTPLGVVSTTGAGGLVAHGGIGWLLHKYGLSVDQVTRMTMILADGTIKELAKDKMTEKNAEDRELFYAARGCAGNLGIVTSLTMMTYPLETITGGLWFMLDDDRYTNSRKLMRLGRDIVLQQEQEESRSLVGGVYMMNVPPEAHIPVEHHHKPCTGVWMGAWGDSPESQALVNQFVNREIVIGKPPTPMPYTLFNHLLCGPFLAFPPLANYWKGGLVNELSNETLDIFCDQWCSHEPWLNASFVGLDMLGGQAGREYAKKLLQKDDNDHCVAGLRDFLFSAPILLYFPPQNEEMFAKAKMLARGMAHDFDDTITAAYCNFHSDMGRGEEKKLHEGLMVEDQARIDAVKTRVDPNNIFSRSVLPSMAGNSTT